MRLRMGAPAAFLCLAFLLAAALARAGSNLNLDAPVVGMVAPASPPPGPRRARALLVVIDGLRADIARTLPFLRELGRGGSRAPLWADAPTYSTAQYVALLAGVPPRDSGVRTNETIRPAAVDDVALRAREAGMVTAVVSTCVDWWQRLFPRSFDEARVVPADGVLPEMERLRSKADFVLLHLCEVDDVGHELGARSTRYADAARAADRLTEALARAWGWPRANVVVTADHGHRDRGGHGGGEPEVRESFLVAGGPDVQPGADGEPARSVDVAPTVAALLGIGAPASAGGRALVELLRTSSQEQAAVIAADDLRRARVAAATASGRQAWGRAETRAQLLRGLPALLAIAFVVWLARRRPRAFSSGLAALVVTMAAFMGAFGPVSFSAARRGIVWVAGLAAMSFVTAAVALVWEARRGEGPLGAAAVVAGFSPLALAAFVHAGLFASRFSCEPAWVAAGPMFAYAALAAACVAAVPITAWQAARSRSMVHCQKR